MRKRTTWSRAVFGLTAIGWLVASVTVAPGGAFGQDAMVESSIEKIAGGRILSTDFWETLERPDAEPFDPVDTTLCPFAEAICPA